MNNDICFVIIKISSELITKKNIFFITIRRRGSSMLHKVLSQPPPQWQSTIIDTPKRKHKKIKYLDEKARLRNYDGDIRQIVADGLGRETPTFFLTNNFNVTARKILLRYTQRNYIEHDIGINVNFFHQDCLCSEVRLNVNFNVVLTVMANNCYRWISHMLKGYNKMEPKTIYRKIVETGGYIILKNGEILVQLDRSAHNPLIAQAFSKIEQPSVPWLKNKKIKFDFS